MSEVVGVWYVALWGGKVTAWLLCFCGESSYQKWEWNVYHDFIFVAAPLAVTDCYVFVFFFFEVHIFRHLSEEQTKRVVESSLGFIGPLRWDEKPGFHVHKRFPQKDSDTNQRHEDFGSSYFCTIGYVEYLDLTCQALKLKFSIFPDTEVWYKEICQGWHRSLALQTNWRGKYLRISGSFFWLKP